MAPFKITTNQEARWAKEWLTRQVADGRFPGLRPDAVFLLSGTEQVKGFIERHLRELDDRQRLQKALSARRARAAAKECAPHARKVTTELTTEAREMLLKIAEHRGLTTSQLILSTFEAEFLQIEG